jgi:hypothetical protein
MITLREDGIGVKFGERYGRLTIAGPQFRVRRPEMKRGRLIMRAWWYVVVDCDCGNASALSVHEITRTNTPSVSCGCARLEWSRAGQGKHRQACRSGRTPLYRKWHAMRCRCNCPTNAKYPRYGGRGIRICDEWSSDFQSFSDWAYANGYEDGLSIDRIDNSGNYEPDNCQWITIAENSSKMWKDRKAANSGAKR